MILLATGAGLRAGGWDTAANVLQVISGVTLLTGLVSWSIRSGPAVRWDELGRLLQIIAEADGLTSEQLQQGLTAWKAEEISAYLEGTRHPDWPFVMAFIALVAGEDAWQREVLQRRIRPVWQSGSADSRQVADSREWALALREAVRARQVLTEVYTSMDRHERMGEGLAEMLSRLTEAVAILSAERRRLERQLSEVPPEIVTDLAAEIGRLTRRLAEVERLQGETSDRLAESERQREQAERLRATALEQGRQAALRLTELDGEQFVPPPAPVAISPHAEPVMDLLSDDDQAAAHEVLRQTDRALDAEADTLSRLQDALITPAHDVQPEAHGTHDSARAIRWLSLAVRPRSASTTPPGGVAVSEPTANTEARSRINTSIPHPARIYDYLLGGKDNFAPDRAAAEQLVKLSPGTREGVRAHRAFLRRAVRYLAAEAGVRQFLDLGAGLPTQGNVHEIAQKAVPEARVVYADNDPIVLAHGRALLARGLGVTRVIEADLRKPQEILTNSVVHEVLGFTQPIAVIMAGVLHFVSAEEDPYGIVEQFKAAVPAGSHLLVSHITLDFAPPDFSREEFSRPYDNSTAPMVPRTHAEVVRFFDGWRQVDPGVVEVVDWRSDASEPKESIPGGHAWAYGGVAVKP